MIITDDDTCKIARIFADNIDKSTWVYSYGGCGTNYLRKVFNIYKFRINSDEASKRIPNIIKSIHVISPPLTNKNPFVAIYVYGNPIHSIISICNRKIANTINVLAGQNIFHNNNKVNLEDILSYNSDILRLEEHFDNWYTYSGNYPIVFINYDTLTKEKLQNICVELKEKYNVNFNEKAIERFKPTRRSSYESISSEQLDKLKKIYNNLILKINSLPDFFIK